MTDKFLRTQYEDGKEGQGSLFKAVRQAIIEQHVRRVLETTGRVAAQKKVVASEGYRSYAAAPKEEPIDTPVASE